MNLYCEKNVVLIESSKLNEDAMFVLETYRQHYKDTQKSLLRRTDYLRWSYILDKIEDNVSILDIGVGAGQFVNMLALSNKPVNSISGLDIRPHSGFIQMFDNIDMHYHNVIDMQFGNNEFDVVTCLEVIEHLKDKDMTKAISELRRVAKKKLIITVPYSEAEPLPKHHLQSFNYTRLKKLFPDANLTFFSHKDKMSWVLIEEVFEEKKYNIFRKLRGRSKRA